MSKAQMLLADLLMLAVGLSMATVILLQTNLSFEAEEMRYETFYSQRSLISLLQYGDGPLVRLLSVYLCEPSNELLDQIKNQTQNILNNFNPNHNYILLVNHTNGFTVYNSVSHVCLEKVNLARFNLTLSCGSAELIFGRWEEGDDVTC